MHLGIVAPLPPAPTGVAEWVGAALPLLEQHAEITCFVEDPDQVDAKIAARHRVRPVAGRHDPGIDMLVYHVGNNPHHQFVFDAIMEGPAGLVEVHDGSLHHFVQDRTLGRAADPIEYARLGEAAHGHAGRRLAEMRSKRYRGVAEMFLYDYLQPVLDRSLGVVVHSRYAEQLVQLRCPRVHTWTIPLHAPELPPAPAERSWTGIPDGTLLIEHLGFVTEPKRHPVYLAALRRVLERGLAAHLVFVGQDQTHGRLARDIRAAGLGDHVTITGYLGTADLERWVQAADVIVNLRAPHVGESSGSLGYGLSAGKPVIVQPIGSWAEIPADVVVRLPVTDDDAAPLADNLFALGQDRGLRERFGAAAAAYARAQLDPHECAERLVQAAAEATTKDWYPPAWVTPTRIAAARTFLASGRARVERFLAEGSRIGGVAGREVLERIVPAGPGARLLAIDAPPRLVQLMATVWGYDVDARTRRAERQVVELDEDPGVPRYATSVEPLDDVLTSGIARYDVIVTTPGSAGGTTELLDQCNLLLNPQGLLLVLGTGIDDDALWESGFSPRVHLDSPGFQIDPADHPEHVTAGVKATLPAAPLHV